MNKLKGLSRNLTKGIFFVHNAVYYTIEDNFGWSSYIPLNNRARDLCSKLRTAFFPLGFIVGAKKRRGFVTYISRLWVQVEGKDFIAKKLLNLAGHTVKYSPLN